MSTDTCQAPGSAGIALRQEMDTGRNTARRPLAAVDTGTDTTTDIANGRVRLRATAATAGPDTLARRVRRSESRMTTCRCLGAPRATCRMCRSSAWTRRTATSSRGWKRRSRPGACALTCCCSAHGSANKRWSSARSSRASSPSPSSHEPRRTRARSTCRCSTGAAAPRTSAGTSTRTSTRPSAPNSSSAPEPPTRHRRLPACPRSTAWVTDSRRTRRPKPLKASTDTARRLNSHNTARRSR